MMHTTHLKESTSILT